MPLPIRTRLVVSMRTFYLPLHTSHYLSLFLRVGLPSCRFLHEDVSLAHVGIVVARVRGIRCRYCFVMSADTQHGDADVYCRSEFQQRMIHHNCSFCSHRVRYLTLGNERGLCLPVAVGNSRGNDYRSGHNHGRHPAAYDW